MFGRHILILVPHPDDEVVGYSAAITRARAQGAEVYALYLTNGCIARETLWPWQRKHADSYAARRRAEGEKTAKLLGVSPIGWNPRPARHLWRQMPQAYTEITEAAKKYAIDQLWVPAYEGGNADHDATNALGAQWLKDNPSNTVLEFAEYNFFGGAAHSQEFPFPNGSEKIITLTDDERTKKREALALYESEKLNLNYVRTERECYRSLARYDYSQPPHPGTLWYARFQWVPFRHPRVDFTKPQDVSDAIMRFLNLTGA